MVQCVYIKKRLVQNTSLNTDLSTVDVAAACVYSGRMRLPLPSGWMSARPPVCSSIDFFHTARGASNLSHHTKTPR